MRVELPIRDLQDFMSSVNVAAVTYSPPLSPLSRSLSFSLSFSLSSVDYMEPSVPEDLVHIHVFLFSELIYYCMCVPALYV